MTMWSPLNAVYDQLGLAGTHRVETEIYRKDKGARMRRAARYTNRGTRGVSHSPHPCPTLSLLTHSNLPTH